MSSFAAKLHFAHDVMRHSPNYTREWRRGRSAPALLLGLALLFCTALYLVFFDQGLNLLGPSMYPNLWLGI